MRAGLLPETLQNRAQVRCRDSLHCRPNQSTCELRKLYQILNTHTIRKQFISASQVDATYEHYFGGSADVLQSIRLSLP